MKKGKLWGIAAMLALLFVFAACDDGVTLKLSAISGPGNLKAEAVEGITFLYWEPVREATSYQVTRKDPDTKRTVILGSTGVARLWYADIVDLQNPMVNDKEYEYTVISVTGKDALNGASRIKKKAVIPATLTVTAPATIDTKKFSEDGQDKLLVTFESEPNLRYTVIYHYGKDQSLTYKGSWESDWRIDNWLDYDYFASTEKIKRYAIFPLLGGDNDIEVIADFAGGTRVYSDYATRTVATGALALSGLGELTGFDIRYANNDEDDVTITWDEQFGTTAASAYAIYKAEIGGVEWNTYSPHDISSLTEVIGDWVAVSTAGARLFNEKWTLVEKNVSRDKVYLYTIVATVGGQKSDPVMKGLDKAILQDSNNYFDTQSFTVQENGTDARKLQVMWDVVDMDATFALAYAQVDTTDDSGSVQYGTTYTLVGSYTSATVTKAANYPEGKAVVDLAPAEGIGYVFRLTATKDGGEQVAYYIFNEGAFEEWAHFELTAINGVTNPAVETGSTPSKGNTNEVTAGTSVRLQLDKGDTFTDGRAFTLQLFYRTSSNPANVFEAVTLGSGITSGNSGSTLAAGYDPDTGKPETYWTFEHKGLPVNATYQYKLIVKNSDGKVVQDEVFGDQYDQGGGNDIHVAGYTANINWTGSTYSAAEVTLVAGTTLPVRSIQLNGNGQLEGLKALVSYDTASTAVPPVITTTEATLTIQKRTYNTATGTNPPNYTTVYFVQMPATFTAAVEVAASNKQIELVDVQNTASQNWN